MSNRSRDGSLICFKDKTRKRKSKSRLPFFRPRPSLIPLFRGRKDKKVREKNENLFSFPSLNRNFALSLQREIIRLRKRQWEN